MLSRKIAVTLLNPYHFTSCFVFLPKKPSYSPLSFGRIANMTFITAASFIIGAVLFFIPIQAYPDRAPICSVSEAGSILTSPHGTQRSGSGSYAWSFQFRFSNCPTGSSRSSVYNLKLSGEGYKGILLYVSPKGSDSHLGSWTTISNTNTKTCGGTGGNTLQHSSATTRSTSTAFTWVS